LESVPKTMKAKVQLLLKTMKSSPDISWNEKEEPKYKGETVQESNVSRCSFGLSDVSPAVLVTNQILWNICFYLLRLLRMFPILVG
jgi:hypothetical protein